MGDLLRLFFIGTVVVTLQWLFFGRLDLWGLLQMWSCFLYFGLPCVMVRPLGTVAGFLVGFALDAIYGLWGIHMLVKTVIGFLVGLLSMINSEVFVRSVRRVVETTLVISLVHNSLLALFVVMQRGTGWGYLLWVLCVGSTLYTTLVAFLAATFWRR